MSSALYHRHLGLPSGAALDDRAAELAAAAIEWFRLHGDPWSGVTLRAIRGIGGGHVELEGDICLTSDRLAAGLGEVQATAAAIVGASAGARLEAQVQRLWREDRPDAAVFLSALGAAEAERLRDEAGERIALEQGRLGLTALPRHAPGYEGWDLRDMGSLVAALDDRGPLRILESCGLSPLKSTVAFIGLTAQPELIGAADGFWSRQHAPPPPGQSASPYLSPERALAKWGRERLTLTPGEGGRLRASFRFDGKTCSSLGRPFAIEYIVDLERDAARGWSIAACRCAPRAGDRGHRSSCAAIEDYAGFAANLGEAPPLAGAPLDAVLGWRPDESATACLCTAAHRNHKWRVVLETIHRALMQGGGDHA